MIWWIKKKIVGLRSFKIKMVKLINCANKSRIPCWANSRSIRNSFLYFERDYYFCRLWILSLVSNVPKTIMNNAFDKDYNPFDSRTWTSMRWEIKTNNFIKSFKNSVGDNSRTHSTRSRSIWNLRLTKQTD